MKGHLGLVVIGPKRCLLGFRFGIKVGFGNWARLGLGSWKLGFRGDSGELERWAWLGKPLAGQGCKGDWAKRLSLNGPNGTRINNNKNKKNKTNKNKIK